MKRKWLLCMSVFVSAVLLGACSVEKPGKNNETLSENTVSPIATEPSVPATISPVIEMVVTPTKLEYMTFVQKQEVGDAICSLLEDEEYKNSLYVENENVIIAIIAEKEMETLSDNMVSGEESFNIVFYDKKNEKILFKEEKIAEQGFQIACAQEENKTYVMVLSRNDYCDIEFYDMNVYRLENGCVQEGVIAQNINTLQWWQEYKPVLNGNGIVDLYVRGANVSNLTNELMAEMELHASDKVGSKSAEYAEKFFYTWEYSHSINIADIDYISNQTVLTQSSVLSDVVEECFKPHQNEPSGTGDKLCGIVCGTVNEEDGYYLMVCKRLGRSRAQGIGHIGIILYNRQGDIVDTDYYGADEISIMRTEAEISVFARWNQQDWVRNVLDGTLCEEGGEIYYKSAN